MEISEPWGYNTLVMFNKVRVNFWLSYSLPAHLPRPLCQASYHATLCCLHLADGLSRRCTGTWPCGLSPCHQSGSRWWWHASLHPCPPPLCSAAPHSSWHHLSSFQLFLTPCWTGCSECFGSLLWDGRWSSGFPCYGTVITNYRAAACGRVQSPPWALEGRQRKPTVEMGIDFYSEKPFVTISFSAIVSKCKTS